MTDIRYSDNEPSRRDIPSFIEPRPPLFPYPYMRPRPKKATNLLDRFEEDSEMEDPDLVQVYLRMKPCSEPSNLYEVRSDKCLVTSLDTTTAGHGRRTQHNLAKMYTFSHIFDSSCNQQEVFDQVVKPNLKKLPDGHSFTLLTYGPSGSGKTYTLMGTVSNPGLVPRALEYIFKTVDAAQMPQYKPTDTGWEQLSRAAQDNELQCVKDLCLVSAPHQDKYRRMSVQLRNDLTTSDLDLSNRTKYYVWVSYVEIYNEAIYDLLAPTQKRTNLRIREDAAGNVYVKGVRHLFVRSGSEAYDVMAAGRHSLVVAATGVHQHSSRSHAVFTITLLTHTEGALGAAQVRLCDLAGCERQRAAHNKGARLLESRAINSSLHVLERCLHVLRRKQRMCKDSSLVPYRESKLTRLLGSGLSGCRGEAVSMVVTLNPAPQFQNETKHVLALAAVAQDIQINNTTFASTLELSQDSSILSSSEIMKLRADNERLHFELLQAQARNKELQCSIEASQQRASHTMREIVDETKAMMTQYYEALMEALKTEMNEMKEEYESVIKNVEAANGAGTSREHHDDKVAQLMTEVAVLKEELAEERLAKELAKRETQHLLQCIEERDAEKAESLDIEPIEEAISSDNESEGEPSDPFNESLEPVYKNECADRSRAVNNTMNHSAVHITDNKIEDFDKTLDDKESSTDTLKDTSVLTAKDEEVVVLYDEENAKLSMDFTVDDFKKRHDRISEVDLTANDMNDTNADKDRSQNEVFYESTYHGFMSNGEIKHDRVPVRDTYFVDEPNCDVRVNTSVSRKTFSVGVSNLNQKLEYKVATIEDETADPTEFVRPKVSDTLVNKIIKSVKNCSGIDNSLNQFEQLEMAANNCDVTSKNVSNDLVDIKILKEKKTYFEENDEVESNTVKKQSDEMTEQNLAHNSKTPETVKKREFYRNIETNSDNNHKNILSSVAKLQERQLYFDEPKLSCDEVFISRSGLEKRTYFDNIDPITPASNKKIDNVKIESRKDNTRSPSIVQENLDADNEPSTIKKLLKESFLSDNVLSTKTVNKKHDSFDLFESPQIFFKLKVEAKSEVVEEITSKIASPTKINEINPAKSPIKEEQKIADNITSPLKVKELSNVELVRKPIERLVLEQKSKADTKQELKSKPVSIDNQYSELIHSEERLPVNIETNVKESSLDNTQISKSNNTTDEFDNICKDISNVRATEFELLVSQEMNNSTESKDNSNVQFDKNEKHNDKELNKSDDGNKETLNADESKYNLRRAKNVHEKAQTTVKRCLRLRRGRKFNEDNQADNEKLKDINNLKKEFSDVTMAVPAEKKEIRDIASPEKLEGEEENVPPMMGIQSCPSKSVTRSRRKLFTPRAEALDESSPPADSNERVYVPRPSYHRTRARRKLL